MITGSGKKDRDGRLLQNRGGVSGSSSVDFVVLVRRLREISKRYADGIDGNCSPYALCAVPMLFSALRCLVIDYESYASFDKQKLELLTEPNDFVKMLDRYKVGGALREEAVLLNELRNEIIHPAHRPTGTADNWPEYLEALKSAGVLQSTGNPSSDYIFFEQMKSHRLLAWSCRVARDIAQCIIGSDPAKANTLGGFMDSWESICRETDTSNAVR